MNILCLIDQTPLPKRPPANYDQEVDTRLLSLVYDMVCQMLRLSFIRLGSFAEYERDKKHVQDVLWAWRKQADRALYRAEIHNFKTRLKAAMLRHDIWRAQVMDRLGAETELARWEARLRRHYARKDGPRPALRYSRAGLKNLRAGKGRLPHRAALVVTEIADCFRLAPLPRRAARPRRLTDKQAREQWEADRLRKALHKRLWAALTPQERAAYPQATTRESLVKGLRAEDAVFQIRPIPLTPEDLRGDKDERLPPPPYPCAKHRRARCQITKSIGPDGGGSAEYIEAPP